MAELLALKRGGIAFNKLSQEKLDTLLLLACCFCILAPYSLQMPGWVSAVWVSLLAWRASLTWRGLRLPPQWLLLPIAIAFAAGVYVSFGKLLGKDSGVCLLLGLLTCKLLEMHAKRDLFVVLFLNYFLLLAQFLYDQSIPITIWVLFTLSLLLCTQLSFQYTNIRPGFLQRWKLAWKILGLALPFCVLTFFLFPRISGPLWGLPDDKISASSGLSDTVSPGDISKLVLSEDIAFRAKITNLPSRKSLYWRAYVLDKFDGRSWSAAKTPTVNKTPSINQIKGAVTQEITVEPSRNNLLFALDIPGSVPQSKEAGFLAQINDRFEVRHHKPLFDRMRYSVVSYTDYRYAQNLTTEEIKKNLQLPASFNPLTLQLADQLKQQHPQAEQQIAAILALFNQEKFEYTLEPQKLGRNSVDEFLFKTRAGFCEHYSSSFVFLMRALGVPARVVTGYQGGNLNLVDGFFEVRQSEAHAWAEVWLPGQGWRRIDPTAAVAPERVNSSDSTGITRSLLRNQNSLIKLSPSAYSLIMHLRMYWDATNNNWYQWVLNFNQSKQRSLLSTLGFDDLDWERTTLIIFSSGVCILLLLSWPMLRDRQKPAPLDQIYLTFCEKMARKKLAREIHEGPIDYLNRLKLKLDAIEFARANKFIQSYIDLKYGKTELNNTTLKQLKHLQKNC